MPGFRCAHTHTRRMRNVRKAQQKVHEKINKKKRSITERQTRKKHALLRKTKTQRNAQKTASTCRIPLDPCLPSPPFPPCLLCTFCFSLFHSAVNVFIAVKLVDNAPRMQKGSRAQSPPSPAHLPHHLTCLPGGRGVRGQRLPLWAAPSCSFLRFCILRPTLRPRTALPSSNMNNMNTNNNNNNTNNNSNKENKHNNNENENNNSSRASPIAAHRSCSCFWSAFCLLIFPLSCSPSSPSLPFPLLFSLPVLFSFFALLFFCRPVCLASM